MIGLCDPPVAGGKRVELLDRLEGFRWPPENPRRYPLAGGGTVQAEDLLFRPPERIWQMPREALPGAVYVNGDFGDTVFSRFTPALCPDGPYRAIVSNLPPEDPSSRSRLLRPIDRWKKSAFTPK